MNTSKSSVPSKTLSLLTHAPTPSGTTYILVFLESEGTAVRGSLPRRSMYRYEYMMAIEWSPTYVGIEEASQILYEILHHWPSGTVKSVPTFFGLIALRFGPYYIL